MSDTVTEPKPASPKADEWAERIAAPDALYPVFSRVPSGIPQQLTDSPITIAAAPCCQCHDGLREPVLVGALGRDRTPQAPSCLGPLALQSDGVSRRFAPA